MSPETQKQLPMAITFLRILIGPVILLLAFLNPPWSTWGAAILFTIGSITDWLDGYLARRWNAQSTMGKFMDPIADKILVLGALLVLLQQGQVEPVMVFLLLSRDILIGGVRSVAAADGVVIDAKMTGKWKTAVQMIAIPCLFIGGIKALPLPLEAIGYWGLWLSVILSVKSGWDYVRMYYKSRTHQRTTS